MSKCDMRTPAKSYDCRAAAGRSSRYTNYNKLYHTFQTETSMQPMNFSKTWKRFGGKRLQRGKAGCLSGKEGPKGAHTIRPHRVDMILRGKSAYAAPSWNAGRQAKGARRFAGRSVGRSSRGRQIRGGLQLSISFLLFPVLAARVGRPKGGGRTYCPLAADGAVRLALIFAGSVVEAR